MFEGKWKGEIIMMMVVMLSMILISSRLLPDPGNQGEGDVEEDV